VAAAVSTNTPLAQPVMSMPMVDSKGIVTQLWWRFFLGLFARSAATIPYLVGTGLTAAGTTQATALALQSEWNDVSSTPSNSGVILNAFGIGFNSVVFNEGGATLKVYPPVGCAIDALGTNAAYSLGNNASKDFYQLTATQFRSR